MIKGVLDKVKERRIMINEIIKRKIKLIGHPLKRNQFITIIMEGKINGKRTRGRLGKFFFEEISKLIDFTSYQKKTTSDTYKWLQRQGLADDDV